jgi:hypothetical protein
MPGAVPQTLVLRPEEFVRSSRTLILFQALDAIDLDAEIIDLDYFWIELDAQINL